MEQIYPKKSLGQNFLFDKNIIKKIIEVGNINNESIIFEVGPGTGNLTKEILDKKPKKFFAIEKDKKLFLNLKKKFIHKKNFKIFNNDALKFDELSILKSKVIVFANLPYNISSQLLAKWITVSSWPPWYDILILMFQKEVAERIIAKHDSKNYGRLSILSNWRLNIKKHFDISRNCFFPKPKINSTLLSFRPIKKNKYHLKNPKILEKITREFFSNRRKMIKKTFYKIFKDNLLKKNELKLNLKLRPENLSNETYYKLAVQYEKLFN